MSEWDLNGAGLLLARKCCRPRGYITSTPKSALFSKKWPKTAKNERASCMPGPKNGERPYLAPSVPGFWDPVFGSFSAKFSSPLILFTITTHPIDLFILYRLISIYNRKGILNYTFNSNSQLIHKPINR